MLTTVLEEVKMPSRGTISRVSVIPELSYVQWKSSDIE